MIFYVVMITISDSAYKQISKLKESKAEPDQHLRLFVESGGCSGFEYGMSFDFIKEDDVKIEKEDLFIIIDQTSLSYLDGCRIDFDDGLTGKGFEINNPNASSTCGLSLIHI